MRLYVSTLRVRWLGDIQHPQSGNSKGELSIITFWHRMLLVPSLLYRGSGYHALVSEHGDGEMIARILAASGIHPVRGSSTRGGARAALKALRSIPLDTCVAVTPDGPRGPSETFQIGAVYLASRRAQPISFLAASFARSWRLPTWDRFLIPWPFSRVVIIAAKRLPVPHDADSAELDRFREEAERRLQEISCSARDRFEELWTAAGPTATWPPPLPAPLPATLPAPLSATLPAPSLPPSAEVPLRT